ncbi:hypothetical protein E2C01_054109 [Portunus trituberculatus]|uniref:Uncharacterized protein n=1 Tax=Portunus trituberculatus TaxID=210409 RepID=A0A5B7GR19_PORTR|nr:hypothetical protein [Portunus trituberculatus]
MYNEPHRRSFPNREIDRGFVYQSLDSIGSPHQSESWEDFQEQAYGLANTPPGRDNEPLQSVVHSLLALCGVTQTKLPPLHSTPISVLKEELQPDFTVCCCPVLWKFPSKGEQAKEIVL